MRAHSTAISNSLRIEVWRPDGADLREDLIQLSNLLCACVQAGASVSFVLPFSVEDGSSFWKDQVLPAVLAGNRCVLLARLDGQIVGSVQLDFATPPNQPHRADVKKLLVHPDARRRGIARLLMLKIESNARESGRTLLTLDTVTGTLAETLYRSLGYVAVGTIPGYALNFDATVLESTTVMYKQVSARPDSGPSL